MKGVIVNLTFEATHCWPDCNLDEVLYLKNKHRHVFHIQAKKAVTHNERETEIILLKRKITEYLEYNFPTRDFKNRSCETLAELIAEEFKLYYCSVLEDGENGAEFHNLKYLPANEH